MISASVLTGCASEKNEETDAGTEYIAVYREIGQDDSETESTAETEKIVLPEAYTYNYFDHVLFVGDEICSGITAHGLLSEEHIISVSSVVTEKLLSAETDGSYVSDMIKKAGLPYIYLWSGVHDVFSDMTSEEYGEAVVETAERIREICPESMVIVLSNTPAAESKGGGDRIREFNDALKSAVKQCPDKYIVYLDIFSALSDTDGYLNDIYDRGDGANLSRAGCRKVLSVIEDNRFYNDLSGDGKYQYLYKDIYAERPEYEVTDGKIAYLTFDDGPSKHTPEILDILSENDIKATFFITGWCIDGKEDTLMRVADEGHTIGLHSWSHDYDEIYASPEAWLDDFAKVYNKVYDITGQKPWAFRFPGGSYNNFNKGTADTIIAEMKRRGFAYYDWNAATSDAMSSATYESCMEYLSDSLYSNHSVVLMHDSLELTPQYLQDVIDFLKDAGYSFETIDTADEVQF